MPAFMKERADDQRNQTYCDKYARSEQSGCSGGEKVFHFLLNSHSYELLPPLRDNIERDFLFLCTRNGASHTLHTVRINARVKLGPRYPDIPLSDVHQACVAAAVDVHYYPLYRAALACVAGARIAEVNFPRLSERYGQRTSLIELDFDVALVELSDSSILMVGDPAFVVGFAPFQ